MSNPRMKNSSDFPDDIGTPDAEAPLVDDQAHLDEDRAETEAEAEAKIVDRLQVFSETLSRRRNEWINARAAKGLDKRWREDVDQYNGVDAANKTASSMMDAVEQGYPVTTQAAKPMRSTVYVQVTRQKTNAGAARLADVVLPTDERNFQVGATPIPNLPHFVAVPATGAGSTNGGNPAPGTPTAVQQAQNAPSAPGQPSPGQGGQPGQPSPPPVQQLTPEEQQLIDQQAVAKKSAEAMQLEIEDCLDEADFNAEGRRAFFDCALLGTAVLKGPVVFKRERRSWKSVKDAAGKSIWSLEINEELRPTSFRVDPRNVYPDPGCGENVQNGIGIFEYERKTAKQIRLLGKQPEYLKSQLLQVLEEGPTVGKALETTEDQEIRDPSKAEVYEHWIYWGEVDRDDLIAAGCDVPEDELQTVSACIEMINSAVVRAYLNPLPDGALPYDMVPWERHPGSVWGFGIPYLMRAQQRVINAAWRMLLDNQGVSSGPQIVVKQGVINPADGSWAITARKVWYADDDVDDVSKAFATFEFNSHQQELSNVIDLAEKLADQESAVPQIAQGEQGSAPETVGGMQMLMNNANVMLKRLVKQVDDYLIKPHIRRYYDYLMEYSDRDDIKGDFQVVALGSSALVVRDIQNQTLVQLLSLAGNPVFQPYINVKKLFEKTLRAQHVDPLDVMNTEAEIQQAQQAAQHNQQPDPRVQAAQTRAQADEQRTQAQVQMNRELLQTKTNIAQADLQLKMQMLQVEREVEMMRMSQKEKVSLEQIRAQLTAVSIKERSKQDLAALQIHVAGAEPA